MILYLTGVRSERRKIFGDDDDREDLVERLADLLPKTRTVCCAWAFLDNHAHFLRRSGPQRYGHADEAAAQRLMPAIFLALFRRSGKFYGINNRFNPPMTI